MGSIRPLITITILVLVGTFLYVKINEGPVRPISALGGEQDQSSAGLSTVDISIPSDTASPGAATANTTASASTGASLAPQWNGSAPPTTVSGASPTQPPSIPPMPELPELTRAIDAANSNGAATMAPPTPSIPLPSHIPTARYPGEPPARDAATASTGATPQPQPPAVTGAQSNGARASIAASEHDSAALSAMAAMGLTPQTAAPADAAGSPPGASPESVALPAADRYNMSATAAPIGMAAITSGEPATPTQGPNSAFPASIGASSLGGAAAPPAPPSDTSFAASWSIIQAALQRGELARAQQLLSPWRGDPSLMPAEAERVETLLAELAGTVIYSTAHKLEPPYTVRPGETLETIARAHDVPWQLLAKINGVAGPEQVRPGQQLKVVRGPFSALVDLRRNEIALAIDGRYAGKFKIVNSIGAEVTDGTWTVARKDVNPVMVSAYQPAPGIPDRVLTLAKQPADPAAPQITLGSGPSAGAAARPTLSVSARDAEDLSDILSIGSRVTIRR